MRVKGRRHLGAYGLILILWLVIAGQVPAHAAHNTLYETRSYYIQGQSTADMDHLGCESASKARQGHMTLFFGAPASVSGTYGVTRFGGSDVTLTGDLSVSNLVKFFILGYVRCSAIRFMNIGIGVSNCSIGGASDPACGGSKTSSWTRGHGAAFGQMVNGVGTWVASNGYSGRVSVRAAWDLEPAWSSTSQSENWMHGYDFDAPNNHAVVSNASADGCPTTLTYNSSTNSSCSNGWNLDWLWHETWNHAASLPFPQVYTTSGTMANQWLRIDEYGTHAKASGLAFTGVLSQYAAAGSGTNTPHTAYSQLYNALNGHPSPSHSAQSVLQYTSDVGWSVHDH